MERTATRVVWPCYGPIDIHDKCARCREKRIGEDPCVKDKPCKICDGFTDSQRDMLATPTYHIRKDKTSGIFVSPEEVTVIATVEDKPKDVEPSFQTPPASSASNTSVPAKPESSSFVTSEQLKNMADQWSQQFARFKALLSRGNVFSTPKTSIIPMPPHTVVSDSPFIAPSARLTSPVDVPAEVELQSKPKGNKEDKSKKKDHQKSRKDGSD